MSLKLERWMRNTVNGPAGRWVMLGLLIFILCVFTVTQQMQEWLHTIFVGDARATSNTAGSFAVLPGDVTEVDYPSFEAASRRYGLAMAFLRNAPMQRAPDMEVWTHLVLLEAAKREHIAVSAEDLREAVKRSLPDYIFEDEAQYRQYVKDNYRVSVPVLEAAVMEYLTSLRVRELYAESFLVGPAATRKAAIDQAASQSIEYAFGDYAALDVGRFLGEAEDELKSEANPDQKLRDFFDKDPSLTLDPERFRHPQRFLIELLYTIHSKIDTDEALGRIRDLVLRAFPEAKFEEPNIADRKSYYGNYKNRLLATAGESLESVTKKVRASEPQAGDGSKPDEPAKPDEAGANPREKKPDEPAKPGEKKPDDTAAPNGGAPPGPAPAGQPPAEEKKPEPTLSPAMQEKINLYGYQIVKDQVGREVTLRTIYDFLHAQTKDKVSLKDLYEKLKAVDDPQNPICSTEPGKGLIEYRDFDGKPLTAEELEEIEDSGVKFGFSFKPRVTRLNDADLPKMEAKADTLGDEGHGRQMFRLLEVIREQRKTFDELTAGEKEELKRLFYLPERARARAKEKLEALRQRLVAGDVKPEQFRTEAEALGCRVHEGEWIEASYDTMREPDRKKLWPDEYLHMRDRYFLRRSLAQVLDRDRAKPEDKREWNPPCYLPVDLDTRGGVKEPGAAYLFHLRERKRPDATTITPAEMSRFLRTFISQRAYEFQERWAEQPKQLIGDFNMVFDKEMQTRIDEDLKHREDTRRRGNAR